jgi:hypothetical protein
MRSNNLFGKRHKYLELENGIFLSDFYFKFKGIVSWDIDGLFTILTYSLDVGPLQLGILFFNFMFSYFNININVGTVLIQTAPAFPEKMAQFG